MAADDFMPVTVLDVQPVNGSTNSVACPTGTSCSAIHVADIYTAVTVLFAGKKYTGRTMPIGGGSIYLMNHPEEVAVGSTIDARNAGIETVFQALALAPTLDIVDNVYLGREQLRAGLSGRWLKWTDKGAMRRQVAAGFERLGLKLPPLNTVVSALSGGQRQAVAIARAVIWGGRIVLLDEPTAALGVKQTEIVLTFIERLKSTAWLRIFISHNMQQVLRVVGRVVDAPRPQDLRWRPREPDRPAVGRIDDRRHQRGNAGARRGR
jgi:ABC-type lipoprotein export system ATPase subunit